MVDEPGFEKLQDLVGVDLTLMVQGLLVDLDLLRELFVFPAVLLQLREGYLLHVGFFIREVDNGVLPEFRDELSDFLLRLFELDNEQEVVGHVHQVHVLVIDLVYAQTQAVTPFNLSHRGVSLCSKGDSVRRVRRGCGAGLVILYAGVEGQAVGGDLKKG